MPITMEVIRARRKLRKTANRREGAPHEACLTCTKATLDRVMANDEHSARVRQREINNENTSARGTTNR